MNKDSLSAYNSAYDSLKDGEPAKYRQVVLGAYVDGEVINTVVDTDITCYVDKPSVSDVQSGLALLEDAKVLIASKSMPLITPKVGESIVFTDKTLQIKKSSPVKSLDGVVVLHQLFATAG